MGGMGNDLRDWRDSLLRVGRAVAAARPAAETATGLSVVFHVPGEVVPGFDSGPVEVSRYDSKRRLMLISVTVDRSVSERLTWIFDTLRKSIEVASDYAQRRGVEFDASSLLRISDEANLSTM